jgi:hypothetical protein
MSSPISQKKVRVITPETFDRMLAGFNPNVRAVALLFTESLTSLVTVCILSDAIFSRRPRGEHFKQRNWQNNQNLSSERNEEDKCVVLLSPYPL